MTLADTIWTWEQLESDTLVLATCCWGIWLVIIWFHDAPTSGTFLAVFDMIIDLYNSIPQALCLDSSLFVFGFHFWTEYSFWQNLQCPLLIDSGIFNLQCCLVDWLGSNIGIHNRWFSSCSWHIPKSSSVTFCYPSFNLLRCGTFNSSGLIISILLFWV
jgi:hypothetical protein